VHDHGTVGTQPTPVMTGLPSPVLAISVVDDEVWLGGAGGVASVRSGRRRRDLQAPPFYGPVTALHPARGSLVAGGTTGIAVLSATGWYDAEVRGGRSPLADITSLVHEEQDILLAATVGDGVLRSEDGGRTWVGSSFGLTDREVITLAVNAASGTVLAGTSDGLFRSTKAGLAWRRCPAIRDAVAAATYCPDGTAIVVLEAGGALRSADDGETWVRVGDVARAASAIVATPTGLLLVGTMSDGLWRSDDHGSTFVRLAGIAPAIHCLATGPNRLYLSTDTGPMTSDDGLRWVPLQEERATCSQDEKC